VKQLVSAEAYRDRERCETVCVSNVFDFLPVLEKEFGEGVNVSALNIERGEVLVDARGTGSFQQSFGTLTF